MRSAPSSIGGIVGEKLSQRAINIAGHLTENKEAVVAGRLDLPGTRSAPYDLWLDGRLESGRNSTWLASRSLYAATTFTYFLGTKLHRHDPPPFIVEERSVIGAQAAGLETAGCGEDASRDALEGLAARATEFDCKPLRAYGALPAELSRDYLYKQCFDKLAISRRMHHHKIANCGRRRCSRSSTTGAQAHSLCSAELEIAIGPTVLERLLVNVGAI